MNDIALGILPNPHIEDVLSQIDHAVVKSAALSYRISMQSAPLPLYVAREGLGRLAREVLAKRLSNIVLHYPLPVLRFRHRLSVSAYDGMIYWDIQNPEVCDNLMSTVAGVRATGEPTRYGYVIGQMVDWKERKNVEDIFLNQETLAPAGLVLGRIGKHCEFTEILELFRVTAPILT